jgi:hypothetical protein
MVWPPAYSVPATGAVMVAVGALLVVTVSVAVLLVAVPAEFLTTQRKPAPLSPVCAEASV